MLNRHKWLHKLRQYRASSGSVSVSSRPERMGIKMKMKMKIKIVGQHKRLRDFYIRLTLSALSLIRIHILLHILLLLILIRIAVQALVAAALCFISLHCDVMASGKMGAKMLAGIN